MQHPFPLTSMEPAKGSPASGLGRSKGSVGSGEMLHEMSHATPKCASDLRVRLRLKIGESRARAVQHGSTAVGATEPAALRRLMVGRKHDHMSPTPMPEVRDEQRHDGYGNPALRPSGRARHPREPAKASPRPWRHLLTAKPLQAAAVALGRGGPPVNGRRTIPVHGTRNGHRLATDARPH